MNEIATRHRLTWRTWPRHTKRAYWRTVGDSGPSGQMPPQPILLTMAEACTVLRVSRWTLNMLIQRRQLGTIKIGSRRLIPMADLQNYIERLRADGAL